MTCFKTLNVFLGLTLVLCADGAFINKNTDIFLNKTKIGEIEVLTPVEIIKKNDLTTTIKVKGAVLDNYKLLMQKSIFLGEKFIEFENENSENFKPVKEVEDSYGEIWHEVEGIYDVNSSAIVENNAELYKEAKTLYQETCSACHRLHETKYFTVNQWPASFESMIEAGYVHMDKEDMALVIKYLQQHAKDSKTTSN